MICSIPDCDRRARRRGWCDLHYGRWWRTGTTTQPLRGWVNPLVCVCPEPDADPRRDYGMCQTCKRKPLALMAATA